MSCGARSARGKARRARKAKARALQLLLKLLLSACLHKHEDDLEDCWCTVLFRPLFVFRSKLLPLIEVKFVVQTVAQT